MSELQDILDDLADYDGKMVSTHSARILAQRIAELEAKIESLRTCKTCGQDKVVAEIGERFGYRADIMALRVREVEAALKRVRGLPEKWRNRKTFDANGREMSEYKYERIKLADELAAACELTKP